MKSDSIATPALTLACLATSLALACGPTAKPGAPNPAQGRGTISAPVPTFSCPSVAPDAPLATSVLRGTLEQTLSLPDLSASIPLEQWSAGWQGQSDDTGWNHIVESSAEYKYRYHWQRGPVTVSVFHDTVSVDMVINYFLDAQ